MAIVITETYSYENFRTVKIEKTFDGLAGSGLNSGNVTLDYNPEIEEGEFIYDVFYRVTTTLTSGDLAGTFLRLGIQTDDTDAALDSTTGILNTLNSNASGIRITPTFTKATATRVIRAQVGGTDDITGGTIEVILTIGRNNVIATGTVTEV